MSFASRTNLVHGWAITCTERVRDWRLSFVRAIPHKISQAIFSVAGLVHLVRSFR